MNRSQCHPVRLSRVASAFLVGVTMCLALPASGVTLVDNGKPAATIIIPANAQPPVKQAADQLSHWIKAATGAQLPIVTDDSKTTGDRLYVGMANVAREAGVDPASIKRDGYIIKTLDDHRLLILGNDYRRGEYQNKGTVFGADRLLHELGFRWIWPGKLGTVMPKDRTLSVASLNLQETPGFLMRDITLNVDNWKNLNRCGATLFKGGKEWNDVISADDVTFATHPDWFAMDSEGKRQQQAGSIDVSNPEVIQHFVEYVRNELARGVEIVDITDADGRQYVCQCPRCKALDRTILRPGEVAHEAWVRDLKTGEYSIPSHGPTADRWWWFANQIVDKVTKTNPKALFSVINYHFFNLLPEKQVPSDKIVMYACVWAEVSPGTQETDAAVSPAPKQLSPTGVLHRTASVTELLAPYLKINHSPYKLTYDFDYVHRNHIPMATLNYDQIAAKLKLYHDLNVSGFYWGESYRCHAAFDGGLYYLAAQLMWNPTLDPKAVLDDYYTNFWRESAEPIRQYEALLQDLHNRGMKMSDSYNNWDETSSFLMYDDKTDARAKALLKQAASLATEPLVKDRVAVVSWGWDFNMLRAHYIQALRKFQALPKAQQTVAEMERFQAMLAQQEASLAQIQQTIGLRYPSLTTMDARAMTKAEFGIDWAARIKKADAAKN
jgi:hypothetical protein